MNHKSECLLVVPVPNHAYYEVRTVCVCGLHEPFNRESSVDPSMRSNAYYPSDRESIPNPES